jgi:ribosome-associated toxin RatA of RatAB toxin-antitoxin module
VKRTSVIVAVIFILLCGAAAWAGPVSDKLTPEEIEQLKAGRIMSRTNLSGGAKKGFAVAFGVMRFNDPLDFWRVLSDYDHFQDFLPRVQRAIVIRKNGTKTWLELTIDGGIKPVTFTNIYTYDEARQRSEWVLELARPHVPYKKNSGYWQLEKLESGVYLVEYRNEVEVDFGMMAALANRVMASMVKEDLPKIIENVRQRIGTEGVWMAD